MGKMKGLTFTQYNDYRTGVATFNRVETYNSNVSTLRGNGKMTMMYYEFVSYQEQTDYTLGNMILLQNNPGLVITRVQKN